MSTISRYNRRQARPRRFPKEEVKALVRYRDGYRCVDCGMTAREHIAKYGRTLDVHRIVPGGRYTVKGCVSLCRECHGPKPRSQAKPYTTTLPKPNKGDRHAFTMRLPRDLWELIRQVAESRQSDASTVITGLLLTRRPELRRELERALVAANGVKES